MVKKILVITGSPRKNGNSSALADIFINTAEAKGYSVTRVDAAFMNVGGCRACDACFSTGKACCFDDDFNIIAHKIEAADSIVFVSPVYWYTYSAQIKAVIDKFYTFLKITGNMADREHTLSRGIGGKEYGLIACCEENDISVMDGLCFSFERTVAMLEGKIIGKALIPGVFNAGDVQKTGSIEQAKTLAEKF